MKPLVSDDTLPRDPLPARPALLVRVGGAVLALGIMEIALTLGFAEALSISPHPPRLVALIAGALIAPTRAARWLWGAGAFATLLLLVISYTPLVERPALALLRADADGPRPDAIVVFSGSMTDAGHIGDIALTRLVSALDDARRLGVADLVVSEQMRQVRGRAITTGADQRHIAGLLGGGVQVHVVGNVSTTYDESLAFAALARTHRWTRVRAVTSPLHARRACATLEATGLLVTCVPATSREVAFTRLGTPEARLIVTRGLVHEVVGLLVYRLRGRL